MNKLLMSLLIDVQASGSEYSGQPQRILWYKRDLGVRVIILVKRRRFIGKVLFSISLKLIKVLSRQMEEAIE